MAQDRRRRGRSRVPAWVEQGARVGLAVSLQAPALVLGVYLVPALQFGYPLVLLPLLLAGPIAQRGLRLAPATGSALLAGVVSGAVTAASLAVGSQVLGSFVWSLTSPASAPPMPPLPRVALLPASVMTWAQQDVLVFQPALALALGLLWKALGPGLSRATSIQARWLPRSLGARLTLTFGALASLSLFVAWIGFSTLEDMHLRGHRVQLQVEWQRALSRIEDAIDREELAHVRGGDMSAYAGVVDATLADLASARPYPGVAISSAVLRATIAQYASGLDSIRSTHAAYVARPDDRPALDAVRASTNALRGQVDADADGLLQGDDLAHHQRLIVLMLVIAFTGVLGLWVGRRTMALVAGPVGELRAHLLRVARGDFSCRVAVRPPEELGVLAREVNRMTADLDRLYAAERAGRAAAEALAARERELTETQEFWTNTVIHDLKGPLGVLTGYVELLEEQVLGPLTSGQRQAIEEQRRAAAALLGLIEDVNDRFRLQTETLPLRKEELRPRQLLEWVASSQHRPDRPAPLVRPGPSLPRVWADERLIQRTLVNLVENAYKHGGTAVLVTLSASALDDGVLFAVDDTGPGIPAEERERVFERFARGAASRTGSGLGLAFSRLVIERHGGQIWADAAPTGGARICFTLPVLDRASTPEAHVQPAPAVA